MAKQSTWINIIKQEVHQELANIRRRKFKFKLKVIFTLILPVLIVLLTVKVTETYMRIKLKSILTPYETPKTSSPPVPVQAHVSAPQFITPEPVPAEIISAKPMDTHITITEITEDV